MIVERNFKEYTKEQFSKEKNYNAILQKVKGSGVMKKKKILSIAAVLLVVVIVGAMAPNIYANIKWNIEFKEYQNRKVDYGLAAINTAVDEYETNIDMDYIYQDEIGVKLEGLLITDDYFKMNIGVQLPEGMEVQTDTFGYNFAVYDENNNIYGVFERLKIGEKNPNIYWKKLYQELGIDYDKKDVYAIQYQDSCQGASVVTSEKGYLSTTCSMTSEKGFPKSKKLYIRIFDIGYSLYDFDEEARKMLAVENRTISDAEWILEVNVPEEFYQREMIELKMAEEIEGLELTKAEVTETGLSVKVKHEDMMKIIEEGMNQPTEEFDEAVHNAIHIEDEAGNKYYNFGLGTTGNQGEVKMKFDINKEQITEKTYYICTHLRGEDKKVELEIK